MRSKVAAVAVVAGLVIIPALWLLYTVRLANRNLDQAIAQNLPLAEGPEPQASVSGARPAAPVQVVPEPAWTLPLSNAGRRIALARELETKDPKRSRELLEEALRLEPNNERALRMLAQKQLIDENFEAAEALSTRCLRVNSTNYGCKKVDEQTGKMAPALEKGSEIVDRCLLEEPNSAPCLLGKIAVSFVHGSIPDATAATERLAQVDPESGFVTYSRGRLRAAAKAYAEARVLFDSACGKSVEHACFRAEVLRGEGF